MDWKNKARRSVSKLSKREAIEMIDRINSEGSTIEHKDIRTLTGGFASQNINFYVMQLLGKKAGYRS